MWLYRRTCTNLLESLNDWTINLTNATDTRVAFIDFANEFDSVSHTKLIYKLFCLGVTEFLLNIIKSFLSGRSQKVFIQNSLSETVNICSAVPQGSVLGPVLFVIYISDLTDVLFDKVISKYFAYDVKLYTEIKCADDIDNLQFNIDRVTEWTKSWQLSIAIKSVLPLMLKKVQVVVLPVRTKLKE